MRLSIWEKLSIEQLREIELKRAAYENAIDHIKRLKEEASKVRGPVLSTQPCEGGKLNKEEERRLNNLSLCEEITANAKRLRKDLVVFDQAWNQLTNNEQLVLECFYINRPKDHVETLMEKLNFEKSKVYYLKDDALYKFTMLMYGSR